MQDWWKWWLKWWVIVGLGVLIVMILSEPPRLWFYLAVFVALMIYGFERSLH